MATLKCQVCIAGGGPAGLMLGYLLARQGADVIVLEKHADFLRDFRGDTIHPATLEIFHELGLADGLLALPHQKTERITMTMSGETIPIADFTHLPVHHPFVAMMPQWDLLDFLADEARKFPNFRLFLSTEAERLIETGTRISGLVAEGPDGPVEIQADLVVAADGRGSRLRDVSGLAVEDIGAPVDVFWMRLDRAPDASNESLGRVSEDGMLVLINRGDYWQGALPLPKGSADTIRAQGLPALRDRLKRMAPFLGEAPDALTDWDQIKLLTVQVNHMPKWWRPGFLCIGDAAHAMSPVGGVGINLAVQDAVAAARILAPLIGNGPVPDDALADVQKRRYWPARMVQRAQVLAHRIVLVPAITAKGPLKVPLAMRLFQWFPWLRRLPARAIGLGLRPEHWPEDWRDPA
jgi:2-polyprenyl-6-methoxyphenol hydroxylase-like FAD-dependent oxidoreductase